MEYFFLLSLVKINSIKNFDSNWSYNTYFYDIIDGVIKLARLEMNDEHFPLPQIGKLEKSNTCGYGYGEQFGLEKSLINFSKKVPNVVLAFYHIYWNGECLSIYTVNNGNIKKDNIDLHGIKIGDYLITPTLNIDKFKINNNLTCYFNKDYLFPFEYK